MNLKFHCESGGVAETKKCNKYAYENKSEMHRHHEAHIHIHTYIHIHFYTIYASVGASQQIYRGICLE